ncbi:MAG: hypothetical protein HQ582_10455 [Planctomycetes bacterium]|nr:hypothetical protein [Planctomycetota bacterium]
MSLPKPYYDRDGQTRVAILCASKQSVYHEIPGVEVYGPSRNARTFDGGMPIVAHPPCRAWSAFMRHWAKPEPGEMELGLWCAEQLRLWGGVLEQPAHSRLFEAAGLPLPPHRMGELQSIAVKQRWWGYPTRKATWLCFCRVDVRLLKIPFELRATTRGDRETYQNMSHKQRSATTPDFARWLVEAARLAQQVIQFED